MDGRDDIRPQPSASRFLEAVFANSASSPADTLMVLIPDFGDQPFGDPDGVVWSPMGGALPQAGDRALVAESDDGSWWVIAWWSSNQDTGVSQGSVDALDTRLDAVEADLGGRKIACGSSTVTFTTATNSAARTVAHGLGRTPTAIAVFGIGDTGVLGIFYDCITTPNATSFDVVGYRPASAISGTFTFTWIAIG